ncbi:MAG TPA: lytic transglycosylase domain-containing protein [Streptosporangiaceae bacterium]|nr:lytic transglycosylase domain-containing protein [Streptosporangiaceae bacterium]
MTSHRKPPRASKFSTSKFRPAQLRASKPSKLTMTVACSTVLAAGAAAGTAIAWPGPASARPASSISDETLARAGTAAQRSAASQIAVGPAGPGRAITTFKGQHSQSMAAAALAARQAAQAAAARAAAAKAAQAAQAAQQAAASSSTPAASTDPAPPPVAVAPGSAQQIAMSMLSSYGWASSQFSCLNELWNRESGWRTTAENPSGAYGIPQALPGSKMASAGPDWQTSATTQIRWGLGYIKGQYGSPCGAWSHEEATGWY